MGNGIRKLIKDDECEKKNIEKIFKTDKEKSDFAVDVPNILVVDFGNITE